MRKILFSLCTLAIFVLPAAGQAAEYEEIMQTNMEKLFQAQSAQDFQQLANTFERIAQKETDKWHPRYYAAYAHLIMSTVIEGSEQKDQQLDLALDLVKTAKELSPKNSELVALEGFIHMLRIPIDPASRGPQYSGMGMGAFHQAIALNPNNPRAHMLLSDMQFGTARFFGSDTSEACASLDKALVLFDTFQPEYSLDPTWGKAWAEQKKAQCL